MLYDPSCHPNADAPRLGVADPLKKYKRQRRVLRRTDIMPCGRRRTRRTRRRKQRGGILPFLIPAAIALGKAAALGAASGAAGYGAKKAIQAATRKKKK